MGSLPRKDFRGQKARISMMQLRSEPGRVIDLVKDGLHVEIEKAGKLVAVLIPASEDCDEIAIHSDGKIKGRIPLTFGRDLGCGNYGD